MDAEDYRDHLPCEGTPQQREIATLRARVAELESGLTSALDGYSEALIYKLDDAGDCEPHWKAIADLRALLMSPATKTKKEG